MKSAETYLAFDLGAESGRGVIGAFDGERLQLKTVHRFATGGTRILDTLHWNILRLFDECRRGLATAAAEYGPDLAGIGCDTWAVDFGLLGRGDVLLGNPRHYRDHANDGLMDSAFQTVPRRKIFDRTGIQFLPFNTLYQLLALQRENSPLLQQAESLLMIPDLLHFWLTGEKTTEFTNASTTQMLDPRTGDWADDLLTDFGLPRSILLPPIAPGTTIGTLRPDIARETGCQGVSIIAPGTHDTASAIVAVPAQGTDWAYISSGTWSLVGIETAGPIINDAAFNADFTNEGGANGTTRLLKNVMGLWLVQQCRQTFARQGDAYDYEHLTQLAANSPAFGSLIEPDDSTFLAPEDMANAIRAFCARTDQAIPDAVGAIVRTCLESLALKYRWVLERLEELRGRRIETVHIVGGGTQNRLLCQLTADATQRVVVAGPVEATAAGNVLMQAIGRGRITNLDEARAVVRASFTLETYTPGANRAEWDAAYQRFLRLRKQS